MSENLTYNVTETNSEGTQLPLIRSILLICFSFVIIAENTFYLTIICKNAKLHTSSYVFIVSLAFTDITVGVIGTVSNITYLPKLEIPSERRGIVRTVGLIAGNSMVLLSSVHMAIISVERYAYIIYPYWYQRHFTPRLVLAILVTIWGLSFALTCFIYVTQNHANKTSGTWHLNITTRYAVIVNIYFTSTFVTGVFYSLILRFVKNRTMIGVRNVCYVNKRKVHRRRLKFFIYAFGIYLLLTSPYILHMALDDLIHLHLNIHTITVFSILVSSVSNFVVLTAMDSKFRHIVKKSACTHVSTSVS